MAATKEEIAASNRICAIRSGMSGAAYDRMMAKQDQAEQDREAGKALRRLDDAAGTTWSLRKINGNYEVWLRGVPRGVSASLADAVNAVLGE